MRCLAGGMFNVVGGQWLDSQRSPVCNACPSPDPSFAICEGKTVKSQPGYFSHYTSTGFSRRSDDNTAIAVTKCPNQQACKHVGLIDSVCETSVSICNEATPGGKSTKCDAGYTGILRPPQAPAIDPVRSRSALCRVRQWLVLRKTGAFTIDHARAHHVCAQSALECKTCANASLLVVVAIVSTLGVYAIGVVLGQKTVSHVDTQVEDPTLENEEVGLFNCSAVLLSRLRCGMRPKIRHQCQN